jgi:hypothetical protein
MRKNWAKTIFIVVVSSFLFGSLVQFEDKNLISDNTNQSNIIMILNSHGGGSGSGRDK